MDEICNTASNAYYEAVSNGHTEELQEKACKDPFYAYFYAYNIKGADIRKCQKMACKDPYWACWFARDVEMANIKYCQDAAYMDPECAYLFANSIVGADWELCFKAVKGTKWEVAVNKLFINSSLE